jgi:glyoxylate reductase
MAPVFVTRKLPGNALERLSAEHDLEVWPGDMPPPREDLLAGVADAEGLLSLLTDRVDAELLEAAPKLRAVANFAIGFDNIDLEATAARGVQVGNTPDVLTDATADLAWALMLAVARRIVEASQDAREGRWRTWEPQGWIGADVHGATLAVVGAGRIGQAVAKRAAGFDMEVLMVDLGDDLHGALERADFVSIHTPLTPETHHLIDAGALARMKPTAILVNTARGPIVDQDALAAALRDGRLAGAGLDVTDPEPLPPDHPLWSLGNAHITMHLSGIPTAASQARAAERFVRNCERFRAGEPLEAQVDLARGY